MAHKESREKPVILVPAAKTDHLAQTALQDPVVQVENPESPDDLKSNV